MARRQNPLHQITGDMAGQPPQADHGQAQAQYTQRRIGCRGEAHQRQDGDRQNAAAHNPQAGNPQLGGIQDTGTVQVRVHVLLRQELHALTVEEHAHFRAVCGTDLDQPASDAFQGQAREFEELAVTHFNHIFFDKRASTALL